MTNYVYLAESLDGYIATSDGGLNWLEEIPNPEKSDFGFSDFMDKIDALIMGRNTFEKVQSFGFWPYKKPVFVLSNTLDPSCISVSGEIELLSGDIKSVLSKLHKRGYSDLYIDGGKVIQSFLSEDLIDEMIITRIPVLLGGGISLFGSLPDKLDFNLVKTEVLTKDLVKSYYVRNRL